MNDREKGMKMLEKVQRDLGSAFGYLTGTEPAYAMLANLKSELDRAVSLLKKGAAHNDE